MPLYSKLPNDLKEVDVIVSSTGALRVTRNRARLLSTPNSTPADKL